MSRISGSTAVHASMSPATRELLREELELESGDVFVREGLLDLSALWQLYRQIDRPELK